MNLRPRITVLKIGLVGALLALLAECTSAQSFRSFKYNELNGLPSARTYDIKAGPDHRVWFATRSGIAAFDGVHWEAIHREGMGSQLSIGARHLAFDSNGDLWVAGDGPSTGISVLRAETWEYFPSKASPNSAVSIFDFSIVSRNSENTPHALWSNGALMRFQDGAWVQIAAGVSCIQPIPEGLLLATVRGVEILSQNGKIAPLEASRREPVQAAHREYLPRGKVKTWVLSQGGLYSIEEGVYTHLAGDEEHPLYSASKQQSLQSDGLGGLYIGDYTEVNLYSEGRVRPLDQSTDFPRGGTSAFALDYDSNIWVGTLRGSYRVPPRTWEYFDRSSGLLDNEVSALAIRANGGIVAGHNLGLTILESGSPGDWEQIPFEEQRDTLGRTLDLEPDGRGGFWIAANGFGAAHLTEDNHFRWLADTTFELDRPDPGSPSTVNGFATTTDGSLWITRSEGLARDQGNGFEHIPFPHPTSYVRRIVAGPEGELYACTTNLGLYRWKDGEWSQFLSDRPDCNNVFNVLIRSEGPPLVATLGGLCELRGSSLVPPPSQLAIDAPVFASFEDSRGWLWIGTALGIFRWNGAHLRHFGAADGLPGQEVNRDAILEDAAGTVWFGMDGGLAFFRPDCEVVHPAPTLRSVAAFSQGAPLVLDEATKVTEGSDLLIAINVASIAGVGAPEYRVRMFDQAKDWSAPKPASDNQIHFANLAPGRFQLELQTRDSVGLWSDSILLPALQVREKFWNTWWFQTLSALLGITLVASLTGLIQKGKQARFLHAELAARTDALRSTELRFERLFSLNPAGQLLVDPETGTIQQANESAKKLGPDKPDLLIGSSLTKWVECLGCEVLEEVLTSALAAVHGETRLELRTSAQPDSPRFLEFRITRFEIGDGKLSLVTILDITEERNLREELRQGDSLRVIGQLAGGLAHDFNNLLTTILGHAELLQIERAGNEDGGERIHGILEAGQRGASLVRKLLAFGRRQVLIPELIHLGPVVASVAAPLKDLLGKSITIETEQQPVLGYVRADRAEIDRAVLNLCLNSRDAMPYGGAIKITVRPALPIELLPLGLAPDAPKDWTLLSVKDNGIGMTPEVKARAFEPFFTTKDLMNGAGLGLSTVHGIVSQSSGHLEVLSAAGVGTEMRIFLPTIAPGVQLDKPVGLQNSTPNTSHHILLVEDQADVRMTISSLLQALGNTITEAVDGREALEIWLANQGAYDLVLTDIMMPRMDGIELGEEIAAISPGQRILYMSGYLDQAEKRVPGEFLAKPFALQQLTQALVGALGDSRD